MQGLHLSYAVHLHHPMNQRPKEHFSLEKGIHQLVYNTCSHHVGVCEEMKKGLDVCTFYRAKMIKNKVEVNIELTAGIDILLFIKKSISSLYRGMA